MTTHKLTILAFLVAAASALPLDQSNWQLIPNDDGRLHLVNINPYILPQPDHNVPMPTFHPETDMEFRLFTRSNPTAPQLLQINDPTSITESNFNPAHPTRFTIHGWNGNGNAEMNIRIRDELLAIGDFNVISVDWSVAAVNTNYAIARSAVATAGLGLGRLIGQLVEVTGVDLNTIYMIGFNLGAHVAGNAGKEHRGRINTIFALDPAGLLFSVGQADALSSQDARYVETIMTNAGLQGMSVPLGQANFYPNGGRSQPGCGVDLSGNCATQRAHMYYAESLRGSVPFRSTRCASHEDLMAGQCVSFGPDANMGGEPSNSGRIVVRGVYFVVTNNASPFARG